MSNQSDIFSPSTSSIRRLRAANDYFPLAETERGVEWSSLVDAAAKAIESMTQKALSQSSSPDVNAHRLKFQAAQQRVALLEQKVDRLQLELSKVSVSFLIIIDDEYFYDLPDNKKTDLNSKSSIFQERDDRRQLELQLLNEKNLNKKLQEECTNAKMELKKFAEWFVNAVESTSGTSQKLPPGPENQQESQGDWWTKCIVFPGWMSEIDKFS